MSNQTQLRIIQNLSHVTECGFYSDSVNSAIEQLDNIKTLKALLEISTDQYRTHFRNVIERDMRRDNKNYKDFLNRINKLENTFSFDVDYI